jgi:hypothetical protein
VTGIHLPHLENLCTGGAAFNNIVSDTIRYYIANDMHFNARGLEAYGSAVAKYLAATNPGGMPP